MAKGKGSKKKGSSKVWLVIPVLIILAVVAYFVFGKSKKNEADVTVFCSAASEEVKPMPVPCKGKIQLTSPDGWESAMVEMADSKATISVPVGKTVEARAFTTGGLIPIAYKGDQIKIETTDAKNLTFYCSTHKYCKEIIE